VIAVVPTFGNVPSYLYPQLYASEGNKYDVAALKGQLIQFARDTWFMEFSFRFEVSPHHPLPESLSSIAPPFSSPESFPWPVAIPRDAQGCTATVLDDRGRGRLCSIAVNSKGVYVLEDATKVRCPCVSTPRPPGGSGGGGGGTPPAQKPKTPPPPPQEVF